MITTKILLILLVSGMGLYLWRRTRRRVITTPIRGLRPDSITFDELSGVPSWDPRDTRRPVPALLSELLDRKDSPSERSSG
jgi:hypothetical protein